MSKEEIEALITRKIAEHEMKISLLSGISGTIILAGLLHSIWLLNCKIG